MIQRKNLSECLWQNQTYLEAKPSLFPPSPMVIWTAPHGSNLPLYTRFCQSNKDLYKTQIP